MRDRPSFEKTGTGESSRSGSGSLDVLRAHQRMLDSAVLFESQGLYDQAVIGAQTACEVYASRAIRALLDHRGLGDLVEPVAALLPNYTFQHQSTQKLWTALTGDAIQQNASVWVPFDKMTKTRNGIVHRADPADGGMASSAIQAARAVIGYLESRLKVAGVPAAVCERHSIDL